MSKSISFGFGKQKTPSYGNANKVSQPPAAPKPISSGQVKGPTSRGPFAKPSKSALRSTDDSDDEDESAPRHEAVTGFSASGAILSQPKQEKKERVIVNPGNGDWRRRGRTNLLPSEVQAQQEAVQNGGEVVTVERNEVSTASGLQYAERASKTTNADGAAQNGAVMEDSAVQQQQPEREMTEDEQALAALLDDGTGNPRSSTIIATAGNVRLERRDETADFREDVALRPDSATLEEYAAMPVEEFGMAMLRGMGQKRRANGEVIDLNGSSNDKDRDSNNKKQRKQEGFLGIGAKPAPGLQGVELGAWGKADMRKNNKGQGFFTPVMLEDKRTGERITEDELERRKQEAKEGESKSRDKNDWRERRDRNLERDGYNDKNSNGSSRKRDRDERDRDYEKTSSRSSRRDEDRNRDGRDGDSSSMRHRDRSRSKDRRRRDVDYKKDRFDDREGEGSGSGSSRRRKEHDRDRDRDRYKDEDRYDSGSSRRSRHRDHDYDKDRDRDRDERRHRDRR